MSSFFTFSDTVRSRALTGKPARQLKTAWTEAWESKESPGYLPLPLQYMATSDAVNRIHFHAAHSPESQARWANAAEQERMIADALANAHARLR